VALGEQHCSEVAADGADDPAPVHPVSAGCIAPVGGFSLGKSTTRNNKMHVNIAFNFYQGYKLASLSNRRTAKMGYDERKALYDRCVDLIADLQRETEKLASHRTIGRIAT
jgi:hypothetical protein